MPTTHLQPLQGDQPAHHPLSNQPLSNSTSTALSSAIQNLQLADHSTLVVTGARGRPKRTIRQCMQIDEGPEDEGCSASHCEDPHRVGLLVKCTRVVRFTGKHVSVTRIGSLLTFTPSLCSSISPVCLRGQLKVRCGSVMTNAARTAVSVARSVVLHRICTMIVQYRKYNGTINADDVISAPSVSEPVADRPTDLTIHRV